jgi:hypothetical protein
MATAIAKIPVSFPRNPSLGFGGRLNDDIGFGLRLVAKDRAATARR